MFTSTAPAAIFDPDIEPPITLDQARRLKKFLIEGKPRSFSTVYGWATNGVRGVVLETVRIGRARHTSEEACCRFVERCTMGMPNTERTRTESMNSHRRAEAILESMGM